MKSDPPMREFFRTKTPADPFRNRLIFQHGRVTVGFCCFPTAHDSAKDNNDNGVDPSAVIYDLRLKAGAEPIINQKSKIKFTPCSSRGKKQYVESELMNADLENVARALVAAG